MNGNFPQQLCMLGDRAFPVAAAKTWKSLPSEVTSSKTLQTSSHTFSQHLSCRPDYCKVTEVAVIFHLKLYVM